MGHDFVKYEEHGERFHDGVLWILRHFLLAEARSMESARVTLDTADLRAFIEGWNWLCPGVVTGTDLSEFVQDSPSRWQMMLDLLQRAGDRIAYFGEAIPKDYLEANTEKANLGVRYADIPTRRLLTDIGRLSRLLSKHEPLVAAVSIVEDIKSKRDAGVVHCGYIPQSTDLRSSLLRFHCRKTLQIIVVCRSERLNRF